MASKESRTKVMKAMEISQGMIGCMLVMHPIGIKEAMMVRVKQVMFIWADGGEFLPVLSIEGAGITDYVVPTMVQGRVSSNSMVMSIDYDGKPERFTVADFYYDVEDIREDIMIDFRFPCIGAVAFEEELGEVDAGDDLWSVARYEWDGVRPKRVECSLRPAAIDSDGWWFVLSSWAPRSWSSHLLSRSDLISAPLSRSGASVEQSCSRYGICGEELFPASCEEDTIRWHPLFAKRFSSSINTADPLGDLNPITILMPSFPSPQACLSGSLITIRDYNPDLDDIIVTPLR